MKMSYLERKTGELRIMNAYLLGIIGFCFYFIYDINSITWNNRILQKFFGMGSLFVVASTIWVMAATQNHRQGMDHRVNQIIFAVVGILFFLLLIYTLFFALPFEQTYVQESQIRKAYKEGVYSLCRHPGVLWFAGLFLCLWGVSGEKGLGTFFLMMIFLNVLYVVFQDIWIFPLTFSDYEEYKKRTPFLLPNRRSIYACLTFYCYRNEREPKVKG